MATEMKLFEILDESTQILQKQFEMSYFEALIESMENILNVQSISENFSTMDASTVEQLTALYEKIPADLDPETLRKGVQLATLKAMKETKVPANQQMTPDAIGFLVAYLIEIITSVTENETVHVADLAVGTGNLLYTIHHYLKNKTKAVQLTGVDNDELLLALAATSAAFQKTDAQLMLQDGLRPVLMSPADVIVSDLPVGYYPDDEQAKKYNSAFSSGHSYSHYLLMEQQLHYLKPAHFAFFIVPMQMFQNAQMNTLLKALDKQAYIQGIIELPHNLFANENSRKSIMILQKHGEQAQPLETLVAAVPELKEVESLQNFLTEIIQWKKNNL